MAKRSWRRKGKEGKWYVRFTVPVREAGVIVRKQKEHGTGCTKKSEAEKVADQLEADYYEAARTNRETDGSDTTFDDAVLLYIQNNPNPNEAYYLEPIVEEIGNLALDQLNQAEVQRVAHTLKGHCKPNTQARHIYDPIQTVYNYAVKARLRQGRGRFLWLARLGPAQGEPHLSGRRRQLEGHDASLPLEEPADAADALRA